MKYHHRVSCIFGFLMDKISSTLCRECSCSGNLHNYIPVKVSGGFTLA